MDKNADVQKENVMDGPVFSFSETSIRRAFVRYIDNLLLQIENALVFSLSSERCTSL